MLMQKKHFLKWNKIAKQKLPREAALRETMEEVNQNLRIDKIIHEDSQFDASKDTVFTRLVYAGRIFGRA